MQSQQTRDRGIDLVKAVAICAVLVIHSCVYTAPVGSSRWLGDLFWGALARPAVPLFFLCSGALLLQPEKELPLRRLLGHNLLRIVLAMLVWAMVYKLARLAAAGAFSLSLSLCCGRRSGRSCFSSRRAICTSCRS